MRVSRLSLLALVLLAAGCGGRQIPPRHDAEWHAPVGMLLKYADADGRLTRQQLEAGLRRDFDAADLNHNGVLDPDEVRAVNAKRWDEDQSAISPLQDWNGDGLVDYGEFAATARALFNEYDLDGNGVLTPDEMHGGPPRGGKGGKPGEGNQGHPQGGPPGDGGEGGRGGEPQQ